MEPPRLGLSVSQLTQHIKTLLDSDPLLQDVLVYGEVSNYSRSAAGHVYFTLKDAESAIRCLMWRSRADWYGRLPADGESILVRGYVSLYPSHGQYQLYVEEWRPLGAGRLYLEFEALKARLQAEGLFDAGRKRPLPAFPRAIGLVTSPSAAAYQDILRILGQRFPLVRVVLAPTLVQGEDAPPQIVRAIESLNRIREQAEIDVIILARGGGSLEELWAFNDERVARAIAASHVPVITGVGHEVDFTIADFVADHRAPTPTAAAAAAVPDQRELRQRLAALGAALTQMTLGRPEESRRLVEAHRQMLRRLSPEYRIAQERQHLDELVHRLEQDVEHQLAISRERIRQLGARLEGLNPSAVLGRGFAVVRRRDTGQVVTNAGQVRAGDTLDIRVHEGSFGAVVE
ncbi:MAG: exodeoxyribonuclease VII large subunit [Anaerolineae bacterium]